MLLRSVFMRHKFTSLYRRIDVKVDLYDDDDDDDDNDDDDDDDAYNNGLRYPK